MAKAKEFDPEGVEFEDDLTLNLNEVAEEPVEREALRAGVYDVEVVSAEFEQSKAGNPQIKWVLQTTDPEHNNARFWYYTTLNKQAGINRLKESIEASGVDIDLSNVKMAELDELLTGAKMRARVKREVYEGKTRNPCEKLLPASNEDAGEKFLS